MNTAWETHMALLCRSMAFFLRVNTLYSFVFAIVLDKAISKEVFFIRKVYFDGSYRFVFTR